MGYRLVDLFCGAGGLSLGLSRSGFKPVFAADFDAHACATYNRNIGPHAHRLDLGAMSERELIKIVHDQTDSVDVVAGGPPCQGFSVQRRGPAEDARNDLAIKYARMAIALRPKAILMENVPTILGPRGHKFISRIVAELDDAGFAVHRAVLEAAAYGVPQMRRRAFVVAIHSALDADFSFPEPALNSSEYVTVREAISDLPPPPDDFSEHPAFPNHRRVAVSDANIKRLSFVPEGGGRLNIPEHLQLPCHKNSNGHRHLDVYGRLWWDRPSGTITAMFDNFTRGRFAHPVENRNITSREGARLQSFPDDFVFLGPKKDVARQIGNAVSPKLAQAVGSALCKSLRNARVGIDHPSERVLAVG